MKSIDLDQKTYATWIRKPKCESDLSKHEKWMGLALDVAMHHTGKASPNPTVGAVLVKDSKIIASGATEQWGGRHAEIVCLDSLADSSLARGAELYVTLSPCAHFGKTPPCTTRIMESGVSRVFVGAVDKNPLVQNMSTDILRGAGIAVVEGILADSCEDWHREFFTYILNKQPFIALKWAQTLDGNLVDHVDESKWITGPGARRYTHLLRQRYDSILVGAQTFLKDRPRLDVRDAQGLAQYKHPHVLVFDPKGLVDLNDVSVSKHCADILRDDSKTPRRLVVFQPQKSGKQSVELGTRFFTLHCQSFADLQSWLQDSLKLKEIENILGKPLGSVMVEGGPRLINSCINGYLGNYAHIMISTKIFGRGGRSFVDGPEKIAATVKEAKPLLVGRVSSFVTSEGDIVAEGNLK